MKNLFPSFYENYTVDDLRKIWADPKTRFILDTNVLLSLYSFHKESRNEFISILEKINDRIWIPFHVALEFQRNRLKVIKNQREYFDNLIKKANDFATPIVYDFNFIKKYQNEFSTKSRHPQIDDKINEISSKIHEKLEEINSILLIEKNELLNVISEIDQDKIFLRSEDHIRVKLDEIFHDESLGSNPFDTQVLLDALFKEGEIRYKNKTPPGYEDGINKENEVFSHNNLNYKAKFGDLIIFKEIINFANTDLIDNIIFISQDLKEDWRIVEKQNGKKILGARPELKQEILLNANIENFLIYDIENFLKLTNEYLNISIQDSSYDDIKNTLDNSIEDQDLKFKNNQIHAHDNILKKNIDFINRIKYLNTIKNEDSSVLEDLPQHDPELKQKIEVISHDIDFLISYKNLNLEQLRIPDSVFFGKNYINILDAIKILERDLRSYFYMHDESKQNLLLDISKRIVKINELIQTDNC